MTFTCNFDKVRQQVETTLTREIRIREARIAELMLEDLMEHFREPKHGEEYEKSKGVFYTASAPGEYPAIKFGNLSDPSKTTFFQNDQGTFLGTSVKHGPILEGEQSTSALFNHDWDADFIALKAHIARGAKPHTFKKMGIRSWLRRVMVENQDAIEAILGGKWL